MSNKSVKKNNGRNVPNVTLSSNSTVKSSKSIESKLQSPKAESLSPDVKICKEGDDETLLNDKLLKTKNSIEELLKQKKSETVLPTCSTELGSSCSQLKNSEDETTTGFDELDDNNLYNYKYFPKKTKSIRFINQVRVFQFSGPDTLCESCEPLKKELEQQFRNKEMRKIKGQESIYLF